MDQDEFKSKWNELKGKAKEKWGDLTDDDLTKIEGKKDELIAALQERYKYMKDQATEQVNDWLESIKATLNKF